MRFRQFIESSVAKQRPDEALVLVHPTSLHSYRWNIGYDSNQPKHRQDGARAKADALANAFARAITEFENAGKPIVVLRDPYAKFEDWQYSYPEIFDRSSAKYKRMNNDADDIEKQTNQVAKTLIRKGIKRVVVGGIWYDPKGDSGCVNHTVKALRDSGLEVIMRNDLIGRDDDWVD